MTRSLPAALTISMMLSAGTNNQSRYDEQSQGLAIDAVLVLENLTDSISGVFATRTSAAGGDHRSI